MNQGINKFGFQGTSQMSMPKNLSPASWDVNDNKAGNVQGNASRNQKGVRMLGAQSWSGSVPS